MSITIENPTAEEILAALQNVPAPEVERLRALLNARADEGEVAAEVARKKAELAVLLNEGLNSGPAEPLTRELWAEMLGRVDEQAREKGIEANLREAFLEDVSAGSVR